VGAVVSETGGKQMIMSSCSISLLLGLLLASTADASQVLTNDDYSQIATIVLQHETSSNHGPWTIFIGFSDIDAKPLVPLLQRIYSGKTLVKGNGEDWAVAKGGCPKDKVTGTGATGVFISSPHWEAGGEVSFRVTFAACAIGSHRNTYVFNHVSNEWILVTVERGAVS
jgi:hypothetical protein